MSDPVLSKLLAVDSTLAVQETDLLAQLEAVRAKRASLQSVFGMFSSAEGAASDVTSEMNGVAAAIPAEIEMPAASQPKAARKRKTAGESNKKAQSATAPKGGKQQRRGWQQYVRDEFRKTPLPEVVLWILQDQPNEIFEIANMVDAIFVKSIPQAARKGARERVSNILAEGARKKRWHRGKMGRYSLSKL